MLAIMNNSIQIQTIWGPVSLRVSCHSSFLENRSQSLSIKWRRAYSFFSVINFMFLFAHPNPQSCYMHILAPSFLLWPFLNKVIIFFDISLGCMLKLCLKWKLDCNHYQYLNISGCKSPLNNYTPRSPIDYFSALLRFITKPKLGRNCSCFTVPW